MSPRDISAKLGLTSRDEVATEATRRGSRLLAPILVSVGKWGSLSDLFELVGADVEQEGDAVDVDIEAFGDQVIVGSQSSQSEPWPVVVRSSWSPAASIVVIVPKTCGDALSADKCFSAPRMESRFARSR